MAHFTKNSAVLDYEIKSERLCVPIASTAAAAASIVYSSDLGAAISIAGELQTAVTAAIDSGTNFTAPVAASGIMGILVYNLGTVDKLLSATLYNVNSGTAVLSPKGASSSGVTQSGNIAISLDSSLDFTAAAFSAVLCLDYRISKA